MTCTLFKDGGSFEPKNIVLTLKESKEKKRKDVGKAVVNLSDYANLMGATKTISAQVKRKDKSKSVQTTITLKIASERLGEVEGDFSQTDICDSDGHDEDMEKVDFAEEEKKVVDSGSHKRHEHHKKKSESGKDESHHRHNKSDQDGAEASADKKKNKKTKKDNPQGSQDEKSSTTEKGKIALNDSKKDTDDANESDEDNEDKKIYEQLIVKYKERAAKEKENSTKLSEQIAALKTETENKFKEKDKEIEKLKKSNDELKKKSENEGNANLHTTTANSNTEIEDLKKELENEKSEKLKLQAELESERKSLNELKTTEANDQKKIAELQDKYDKLKRQNASSKETSKSAAIEISASNDKNSKKKSSSKDLQKQVTQLQEDNTKLQAQLDSEKESNVRVRAEIDSLKKATEKNQMDKKKIDEQTVAMKLSYEKEIAVLKAENEELTISIKESAESLSLTTKKLEEAAQQNEVLRSKYEQLKSTLETKDNETAKENDLKSLHIEMIELKSQLEEEKGIKERTEKDLKSKEEQLKATNAKLEEKEAAFKSQEAKIRKLNEQLEESRNGSNRVQELVQQEDDSESLLLLQQKLESSQKEEQSLRDQLAEAKRTEQILREQLASSNPEESAKSQKDSDDESGDDDHKAKYTEEDLRLLTENTEELERDLQNSRSECDTMRARDALLSSLCFGEQDVCHAAEKAREFVSCLCKLNCFKELDEAFWKSTFRMIYESFACSPATEHCGFWVAFTVSFERETRQSLKCDAPEDQDFLPLCTEMPASITTAEDVCAGCRATVAASVLKYLSLSFQLCDACRDETFFIVRPKLLFASDPVTKADGELRGKTVNMSLAFVHKNMAMRDSNDIFDLSKLNRVFGVPENARCTAKQELPEWLTKETDSLIETSLRRVVAPLINALLPAHAIYQILAQTCTYITQSVLRDLTTDPELCVCGTGFQIKIGITQIDMFLNSDERYEGLRSRLQPLRELSNLLIMDNKEVLLDEQTTKALFSAVPHDVIVTVIKNLRPDTISKQPITEELRSKLTKGLTPSVSMKCCEAIPTEELSKEISNETK